MAGIGFELKKLFAKRGILAGIRAYGYASVITTGPMVLSFLLLIGIRVIAQLAQVNNQQIEIVNAYVTYSALSALCLTSILGTAVTRYVSDRIFENDRHAVLGAYYGMMLVLLPVGAALYGAFLFFCGGETEHCVLAWLLFNSISVVWVQMTFLSAIKEYRQIMQVFLASILLALIAGISLIGLHVAPISALLTGVLIGYSAMLISFSYLLHRFFPMPRGSNFRFLSYLEKFSPLIVVGACMTIGLFSHLPIMWYLSPARVQVVNALYGAPHYDVPAIIAFFSILITTVTFTTSVEVEFYPKYRQYFALINNGGTYDDILKSEQEMKRVLGRELYYMSIKQIVCTLLFIILAEILLVNLNIGFEEAMLANFRILCVGYALYAIANTLIIISLYFVNYRDAMLLSLLFAIVASALSVLIAVHGNPLYYGLGFTVGAALLYLLALFSLQRYMKKLDYNIFCAQPILSGKDAGPLTRLANYLNKKALQKEAKLNA